MRGRILGSLTLAILLQAVAAEAQECGPLKQITSLDMTPLPGTSVMTVSASFNGTSRPMVVDTGAGISNLQDRALEALGLHAIDNSRIEMLDSNGNASKRFAQVDDFALGAFRSKNMQFIVAPGVISDAPFVGSLAADVMGLYDTEMDFSARKLNLFSKDHCPGHVLYWNPAAIAIVPITTRSATGDSSRTGFRRYVDRAVHVLVPVTLDGRPFQALIDTGSQRSTMSAMTAKFIFGVAPDSPGSTPEGSVDGNPGHAAFSHIFSALTFDTVTVTHPHVTVLPDLVGSKDPNNSSRTDSRIRRIDDNIGGEMTIGMDVLRKLHLYIAFGERKLYISPASGPVPVQQGTSVLTPVSKSN